MRHVVLLRGVNLAGANRLSMADLRELLAAAGFGDVRTHLQSGNALVTSDAPPARVARDCRRALAEAVGLDVDVLVRTRDELAGVVERDPLAAAVTDPRRYQVTFLDGELEPELVRALEGLAAGGERLVASGRELYAWHPDGVGRSKLAARLAGRGLGVPATARNWRTVTKLLELASE